jgi:hypothetical protein
MDTKTKIDTEMTAKDHLHEYAKEVGELTEEMEEAFEAAFTRENSMDVDRHGSLKDRGGADKWYGRSENPHWYPLGTYIGPCIEAEHLDEEQIALYMKGYEEQEEDVF